MASGRVPKMTAIFRGVAPDSDKQSLTGTDEPRTPALPGKSAYHNTIFRHHAFPNSSHGIQGDAGGRKVA